MVDDRCINAERTVIDAHVPCSAVPGLPRPFGPPAAALEEPPHMENVALLGGEVQRGVAQVDHLVEMLPALPELLCGARLRLDLLVRGDV